MVVIWQMLTRGEDYRYAAPGRTRAKLNIMDRPAGKHAPPTPKTRQTKPEAENPDPGQRGEDDYNRFLLERFGEAGPRGIDHPNSPRAKKPPRSRP